MNFLYQTKQSFFPSFEISEISLPDQVLACSSHSPCSFTRCKLLPAHERAICPLLPCEGVGSNHVVCDVIETPQSTNCAGKKLPVQTSGSRESEKLKISEFHPQKEGFFRKNFLCVAGRNRTAISPAPQIPRQLPGKPQRSVLTAILRPRGN